MLTARNMLYLYIQHRRIQIVLVLLSFLFFVSGFSFLVVRNVSAIDVGLRSAESILTSSKTLDLQAVDEFQLQIAEGEKELTSLNWKVSPVLWFSPILQFVPVIGGDIKHGRAMLDYSMHLVRAADLAIQASRPTFNLRLSEQPVEKILPEVVIGLEEGKSLFRRANDEITLARQSRGRVIADRLSGSTANRLNKADALLFQLDGVVGLGLAGPEIIGAVISVQDVMSHVKGVFDGSGTTSFSELSIDLKNTEKKLRVVREIFADDAQGTKKNISFDFLPSSISLGSDSEFIIMMFELSHDLVQAALPLVVLGEDLQNLSLDGDIQIKIDLMARKLESYEDDLQMASTALTRFDGFYEEFDKDDLPVMLADLLARASKSVDTLKDIVQASLRIPDLLDTANQALILVPDLNRDYKALLQGIQSLEDVLETTREIRLHLEAVHSEYHQIIPLINNASDIVDPTQLMSNSGKLLDYAYAVAQAAELTLLGLQQIVDATASSNDTPSGQLQAFAALIEEQNTTFLQAQSALDAGVVSRSSLDHLLKDEVFAQYLQILDERTATLAAVLTFAVSGSKYIEEIQLLRAKMQDLGAVLSESLLSPENILEPNKSIIPVVSDGLTDARSQLQSLKNMWAELETLELPFKSLGLFDTENVAASLSLSDTVLASTDHILSDVQELFGPGSDGASYDSLQILLGKIASDWPTQVSTSHEALESMTDLAETSQNLMVNPSALVANELDEARKFFSYVGRLSGLVVDLFGYDDPSNIIILGQDDQEIRPTGGFIGSVAEMQITKGDLAVTKFRSSYDIDPTTHLVMPIAPDAFGKYMAGVPALMAFRDSNWSADFPTSAQQALDLYRLTQTTSAKWVVAIDTFALAYMIDAIGGISLQGHPNLIDGEASRALAAGFDDKDGLGYRCGPNNSSSFSNRCFSEDAMVAILTHFQHGETNKELNELMLTLLRGKHLLIYAEDSTYQAILNKLNMSGWLRQVPGDYLMVADWSAYSKVNDHITRTLLYDVDMSDVGSTAHLRVRYQNAIESDTPCAQIFDTTRVCYWNYARVYTPLGIKLLEEPYFQLPSGTIYGLRKIQSGYDVSDENTFEFAETTSHTEMAAFLSVGSRETRELSYRYLLPSGVVTPTDNGNFRYDLTVQKHPGTIDDNVFINIHLPKGSDVVSVLGDAIVEDAKVSFSVLLDTDQQIGVEYRLPE